MVFVLTKKQRYNAYCVEYTRMWLRTYVCVCARCSLRSTYHLLFLRITKLQRATTKLIVVRATLWLSFHFSFPFSYLSLLMFNSLDSYVILMEWSLEHSRADFCWKENNSYSSLHLSLYRWNPNSFFEPKLKGKRKKLISFETEKNRLNAMRLVSKIGARCTIVRKKSSCDTRNAICCAIVRFTKKANWRLKPFFFSESLSWKAFTAFFL